jgi:hypothetical protein
LLNCKDEIENIPQNVVFPSQSARLLIEYQRHPEAKSLTPDGTACRAETTGLLKRAHVIAGDIRYVGKETDRKWEEGDEISILQFAPNEYGQNGEGSCERRSEEQNQRNRNQQVCSRERF